MAGTIERDPRIDTLLAYWFAPSTALNWFQSKDQAAFDTDLQARFGSLCTEAADGALDAWLRTPKGTLALIILLDQLPRNLHRGTTKAFSTDPKARDAAACAIDARFDVDMMISARLFLYLPFEHSETLADQERSIELFGTLGCPHYLRYARMHYVIIERFGRFPHRNKILGRQSAPEEIAFLNEPNSSF